MMRPVYAGPCFIWTLNQTAVAAAKIPGFEPTREGLNALQAKWKELGYPRPAAVNGAARNRAWALAAFNDATPARYEQVPA